MKNKFALLAAALMISACASTPDWGDRSEGEIAEWRKAEVTVEDVDKYTKEHMTARDVLEWKNSEFKVAEDIIAWKRHNFSPEDAKAWKDKGFSVKEASEWKNNKFSLKEAADWKSAGFSLKQAKKDRDAGLVPNQ